ncbi:hypothetical protein BY996DRAFT_6558665 [Phakopsora pachyrhizi]|nr:hypothetical protein BY996DRAFT_6558665 [Phakopsora pachyrhizi]
MAMAVIEDFHVGCWEHQEICTKAAEYVKAEVVETVSEVVRINWVFFEVVWSRWHRNIFRMGSQHPPRSTYCTISSIRFLGIAIGEGGLEYGGNKGVVESAATIGSTADPVPSFALGRPGQPLLKRMMVEARDVVSKEESSRGYHKEEFTGPAEARCALTKAVVVWCPEVGEHELKGLAGKLEDSIEKEGGDQHK